MYGPVPPRRKKTDIIRSRNGCVTCKQQRRKCDETQPSCRQCTERGGVCGGYRQRLRFVELDPVKKGFRERERERGKANLQPSAASAKDRHRSIRDDGQGLLVPSNGVLGAVPVSDSPGHTGENNNQNTPAASSNDTSIDWLDDQLDDGLWGSVDAMLDSTTFRWLGGLDHVLPNSQNHNGLAQPPALPPRVGDDTPILVADMSVFDSEGLPGFGLGEAPELAAASPAETRCQDSSTALPLAVNIGSGVTAHRAPAPQTPSEPQTDPLSIPEDPYQDGGGSHSQPRWVSDGGELSRPAWAFKTSSVSCENRQYFAHFMTHVAELLPKPLQQLLFPLQAQHPAMSAVLALSAANLCHLQSTHSNDTGCRGTPTPYQKKHFANAAVLFTLATGELRRQCLDIEDALTIIMVLTYYEMEIGTVQGQWYHVAGLDTLMLGHAIKLSSTTRGCLLLRTWVLLRARASLFRIPLHLDLEYDKGKQLQTLSTYSSAPTEAIHSVLAQGWSLSLRLLLTRCIRLGYEDAKMALKKMAVWFGSVRGSPETLLPQVASDPVSDPVIYEKLGELRRQLDELSSKMDQVVNYQALARSISDNSHLSPHEIEPIHFESHSAAMTTAYFNLARLLCDEGSLADLVQTPVKTTDDPIDPRLGAILGIAEGLDPRACVYRNTFCLGISVVVIMAALRAPHPLACQYLLDVLLPRLKAAGRCWEDSGYPLRLCQLVATIIAAEMKGGRKVFLAALIGDESLEKDALFSVGSQDTLYTIHGRNPDGGLFNECIKASCYVSR